MLFTKLFTVLASTAVLVKGQASNGKAIRPNPSNGHWVDAWASMPQLTEPANLPPAPFVSTKALSIKMYANFRARIKLAPCLSTQQSGRLCT